MPFCQQVRFTHSHDISKWHPGSRGRNRVSQAKMVRYAGTELSERVYLAFMGVKLEHTVGVQFFFSKCISDDVCRNIGPNQSQNCKNVCFSPGKHNYIQRKVNKIDFCYKFCHICHLGRLAAIIIDILALFDFVF